MLLLWRSRWLLLALVLVESVAMAQAPRERRRAGDMRTPDKLQVGDVAPLFVLPTLDGKQRVALASFKNKKPVALIFGSYT